MCAQDRHIIAAETWHYHVVVPHHHYTTVPRHHCMTVPHHCHTMMMSSLYDSAALAVL